jgi:dihydrodipicolinate synthase/N-acetylneuraminate lyase
MMGQMQFGNFQEARSIHHALAPLLRILETEGGASGIKAILNHFQWVENLVRLPNTPVSEETRAAIYRKLAEMPQQMVEKAMR